jgi:RNA-directed DNA polymerase
MSDVKQVFDRLDQWIRHRLRKILWQQWKTPRTRAKKLQGFGIWPEKAKRATSNGRGPWWNAGAPAMHAAVTNERLFQWGLESLLGRWRGLNRAA